MNDLDVDFELQRFIMKNFVDVNYQGFDPYDFASIPHKVPSLIGPAATFINKLSPYNIRGMLNIQPSYNAKANALLLGALVQQDLNLYEKSINFLLNWFNENKSPQFDNFTLGFSFRIMLSTYSSDLSKSSLIITLFAIFSLIDYFKLTHDEKTWEMIHSFEELLRVHWPKVETADEVWYSYLSERKVEIYNATAKVGKMYAMLYEIAPEERYLIQISKILNYLRKRQNPDGSWPYSKSVEYVDSFHTAFILESIFEMLKKYNIKIIKESFERGLSDYIKNFFDNSQPLHFHRKYPAKNILRKLLDTEIRDCANAIILFSKMGRQDLCKSILEWTFNNLYDQKEEYFYFYSNPFFKCKINYIRWQAWMALAISEYKKRHS